ncbi:MAG TPA: AAA family ATPase [Polyangiaceae bacterium]|nr:AAA family ATPase [Polyangiaceae bacterium]
MSAVPLDAPAAGASDGNSTQASALTSERGSELSPGARLLGGRFVIQRRLGRGGMGVVYEALDRNTRGEVALKILTHGDGPAIYRFKQEFRALADVRHENLVPLHELFAQDGRWFFTMDVVEGLPFLDYVRPGLEHTLHDTIVMRGDTIVNGVDGQAAEVTLQSVQASSPPELDLERLRSALAQLVTGIQAIHAAGKLHRDLKSSNVLVSPEGRVVILDFGLVGDKPHEEPPDTFERGIAGTPAYMAPEQVSGDQTTAASDWYAVGSMLYEALSGRPPFTGRASHVMTAKMVRDPEPVWNVAPAAPSTLAELCMQLLSRVPSDRPGGDEILRRIGDRAPSLGADATPLSPRDTAFVGRAEELTSLRDALENSSNQPRVVFVQGTSGMGKTALVERFAEEARARGAVVLAGRCYERESVPYKALDGAIDALTRYLGNLPSADAALLVPRDIHELIRIFPVLSRVDVVERSQGRPDDAADPNELRRRAFGALRQILVRMADHVQVVLFVDDLQWTDNDSVRLLLDLLSPPEPPPLLFIGTYRAEEVSATGPLSSLLGAARTIDGVSLRTLSVGPLDGNDTRTLAEALLGQTVNADTASSISDECRGSPFFLRELAHWSRHGGGARPMTLDRVLSTRIATLEDPARRLLEAISLAARPVELEVVIAAAGIEDAASALGWLQRARLIRGTSGGQRRFTAYHDRVREAVSASLNEESLNALHGALARALERTPDPDPELLAHHLAESGDRGRAAQLAIRAGDRAYEALAFDQAARLYRTALTLGTEEPNEPELREKLARALSSLGRSKDAADAYLEAAQHATTATTEPTARAMAVQRREPGRALELRRLAAEHYLVSGEIERGTEVLSSLLSDVGLRFPSNRTRAILGILKNLFWLWLRGTEARVRTATVPGIRDQIELLLSANRGYATFSPALGGYFALEALSRSLSAGYLRGIIVGLDYYGVMGAYAGTPRDEHRAMRVLDTAKRLSLETDDPVLRARVGLAQGVAATALGRFAESVEYLDRVAPALESCVGAGWELSVCDHTMAQALIWLGRFRQAREQIVTLAHRSEHNGDRFSQLVGSILDAKLRLASGQPVEARAQALEVLAQWGTREFTFQHLFAVKAAIWCELYEGAVAAAHARFREIWPSLRKSGLLTVQLMRAEAAFLEGSIEIARRAAGDQQSNLVRVRKSADWLDQTERAYAQGYAATLRAGLAQVAGQGESSTRFARKAVVAFERAGMTIHAAALLARSGVPDARAAMAKEGIADPTRWCRIYLPDPA